MMHNFRHKIFLVDDDPGNLNFLKLAFRDDFIVLTARDGEEALKMLKLHENSDVAIIFTDERMPKMTGSKLLEQTLKTHPNSVRWLITAYPEEDASIYDISAMHIDRYIRKPIQEKIDELRRDALKAIELYQLRRENKCLNDEIIKTLKEDNGLRNIFARYLPPPVLHRIEKTAPEKRQEVEIKEVTILYSDLIGFCSITERLRETPETLVKTLNSYFNCMSKVISKHDGLIDKLIGDEIMAVFGIKYESPNAPPLEAQNAVKCALDMREQLTQLNKEYEEKGGPKLSFGIGINTGNAVVGNIGSESFWDYTVIGDEVNAASRIQDLTRGEKNPNRILIGEKTFEYVKDFVGDSFRELGNQKVKGKGRELKVYEIFGKKNEK